ncbi:MAG: glycosyltransferase family 4 protein [Actinomycetota bacterium]
MTGGWAQYLAVFAGSAFLSLLLTPLAIRIAVRRRVFDQPGGHKSHTAPVPYLGGLAVVVAFSVVIGGAALIDSSTRGDDELVKVLVIAVALSVLGLVDDLKKLPSLLRMAIEIGAALLVWQFDLGVAFLSNDALNGIVTVVWIVGIINAFNMSDNMDGLSGGLSAIAALSFFAIAAANGQFLVAGLSAALAGCALGFLRHNVFPAKIYMGDAGAYFFGFMIAYLGLKLQFATSPQNNTFIVPILVCSVVILDTTLVTLARLYHGISPLQGGRDHTSHRLVRVGLPVPIAVAVIHVAAAAMGTVAFVVVRVDDTSGWILAGLCAVLLGAFGTLLALVPVYATSRHSLYRVTRIEDGLTSDR